ncbi:MAG: 2-oxo acid dehydrogenase subunit E2 [Cytophagaceae bacterium]|nr:2-oxo acid dehydrogenase subunit E2 [Cytophagaceae bacterium]
MALKEMVMPKMGESVMEGTILNWLKKVGDKIEQDESVLEVATDKVDTDVPATFGGTLKEILAEKGKVVAVGSPIAIIETGEATTSAVEPAVVQPVEQKPVVAQQTVPQQTIVHTSTPAVKHTNGSAKKFYSPLVMNIAREENISFEELENVNGTGSEGRVTKNDVIKYLEFRKNAPAATTAPAKEEKQNTSHAETPAQDSTSIEGTRSYSGEHEIIQMDRMRKMIADRMLESKRISPHVTSFVEADVTHIVYWRNRMKNEFMEKESAALTFTPIFIEAVVKAIKDYPMINVSVIDGDKIMVKKEINIGMAVALPNGNLIVPVIKNADQLNIVGLTKKVNDLAKRARQNKLTADDLTGGTYTISNVGSFGNLMGTPIIVQPQCAILALGAVVKKPAVIETPEGDSLGIRHMMFLSHSYDHRVIDGSLGGMFVRRVADYLEGFDLSRKLF